MRFSKPPCKILFLVWTVTLFVPYGTATASPTTTFEWRVRTTAVDQNNVIKLQRDYAKQLSSHLSSLSAKERTKAIRSLPKGAFVDIPEFWNTVSDGDTLFDALYYVQEPLKSPSLAALERYLLHGADDAYKFRAAAILYRYHRESGYTYLSKLFGSEREVEVASIFAMNKDVRVQEEINSVLRKHPYDSANLPMYLADWPSPEAMKALEVVYSQNYSDLDIAMACAALKNRSALPLISNDLNSTHDRIRSLYLVACMDKLSGVPSVASAALLNNAINNDSDRFAQYNAISAVQRTNSARYCGNIEAMLQRMLAPHPQVGSGSLDEKMALIERTNNAVAAITALLHFDPVKYSQLSVDVLRSSLGAQVSVAARIDIIRIILRANPENQGVDGLLDAGSTRLEREIAKHHLLLLPSTLLLDQIYLTAVEVYGG